MKRLCYFGASVMTLASLRCAAMESEQAQESKKPSSEFVSAAVPPAPVKNFSEEVSDEEMVSSAKEFKKQANGIKAVMYKKNATLCCILGAVIPCGCPCFCGAALYYFLRGKKYEVSGAPAVQETSI